MYNAEEYKKQIRSKYKSLRKEMNADDKKYADKIVFNFLIASDEYIKSDTVLTYVSSEIEVDTRQLISYSFKIGKKIAVPRCVKGTNIMNFYYINSFDDLKSGCFSLPEPNDSCISVKKTHNSLCIVPALAYDTDGYRIGYGGGFYDRFLTDNKVGSTIGICYDNCIEKKLLHSEYDVKIKKVITEKRILVSGG